MRFPTDSSAGFQIIVDPESRSVTLSMSGSTKTDWRLSQSTRAHAFAALFEKLNPAFVRPSCSSNDPGTDRKLIFRRFHKLIKPMA